MKRIQRQRTKGWRMPRGAVYVGRPSRWGNPFGAIIGRIHGWREAAVVQYREDLVQQRYRDPVAFDVWLGPLKGATALACWCPLDQPCHADVLIEMLA